MKNLRTVIEQKLEHLDLQWRDLPLKVQCRYVIIFFTFYFLVCIGVLATVWYELGKDDHEMEINHIESPAVRKGEPLKPDSVLNNPKNLGHGRERE